MFVSNAADLVAGDVNGQFDVFVRDRTAGTTQLVSVASDGSQGLSASGTGTFSAISADGRYVAFQSAASLVPGDIAGEQDVFLRDRTLNTTRRLSETALGGQATLNGSPVDSSAPQISSDGSRVVFQSPADGLTANPDTNGTYDIFAYSTATSQLTQITSHPQFPSLYPSISADGSLVAFQRLTLFAGLFYSQVFVSDANTGAVVDSAPNLTADNRGWPRISANGRFVTFALTSHVTNATKVQRWDRQLSYVRDIVPYGFLIAEWTSSPMSADGRLVATVTQTALVASDTNFDQFNPYNSGFDAYIVDTSMDPDPIPDDQTFGGFPSEDFDANPCLQRRTTSPINTATGAESLTVTDAAFPSPGIPFEFTRSYTSLDPAVGILGVGWTHPFLASLAVTSASVKVTGENGQRALFVKQQDGSFAAPPGVRARLVQTPTGYTLTTRGHRVMTFDTTGRLTGMTLRGQGLSFTYDGSNKMASVTDSAGRVVAFTYTTDGSRLARVSLPDGRFVAYTYDAGNRLQSVRDLRGGTTTYTYDAGDRVASETDPNGHLVFRNTYDATSKRVTVQLDAKGNQTLFAWDAAAQTSTMTDPRGGVWREVYSGNVLVQRIDPFGRTKSYGHDGRLNCTSTTDGRGNTTAKEYDAHGNLTKVTSPAPVSAAESRTYDANDNLTSVTDPRGKTTSFTYDGLDRVSTVTDPAGKVTTYAYNSLSLVASVTDVRGKVTGYGYDASGNPTSVTSPLGKVTTMGYDTAGRVVWRTDPRGNASGGNPLQYRTTITYNDTDQMLSITDPLAHVTAFEYDPVGNRTKVTDPRGKITLTAYDELNRPTTVTDPNAGVSSTTYDLAGNVDSRTSQTGDKTTYAYDLAGQLTGMTMPRGNVAGATAETYTWHYDYDAAGNRTTVTDPADKVTTTAYDNLNRSTLVTDPLGHTSSTGYDNAGNTTSRVDGVGGTTTFTYDNLGRFDTVTSPRGNAAGGIPTDYRTKFVYDEAGNRTEITAPKGGRTTWAYDNDNRVASQTDPRGYVAPNTPAAFTTNYTYDDAGNLTRVTDPLGNQTNTTIDEAGRKTAVADANNRVTAYGYDAADELTSVLGPDAPTCTGTPQCVAGKAATVYAYDNVGNLTQRIDPKNHATAYQYDLANRLTRKTNPLGKFESFTYNPDSNPATHTIARGNAAADPATGRVSYTYDPVGRLTRIDYPDATPDVAYTYDDAGRRASMVDGGGTVNYTYDNADRATNINRVGGDAWAYVYDPDSDITKRTYPDTTVVDATFDRDGNLASIAQDGQATTFAYDEAGRLKTTTLPSGNGHVESRAYDNAGRLTQVKNAKGATVLSQFTRTLDPVGNPTLVATLRGATTTNEAMQYDVSNRLTKWCQAASCTGATKWISYAYDAVGNRSQQVRTGVATAGTTTYTYDVADQMTQSVVGTTTTTSTYDEDGNQKTQGTTAFTYDLANRMTSNKIGTATATNYTYDGNNNRRTRATGTTVNTKYSWDTLNPLPELALERNNSNALIRRYVQGPAGPITMATSPTATFYYHRDHLGSITDVTDSTGAAQWKYDYEPYGAQLTATKVINQAPVNPTRYTGEYLDTELTDYNLRARQYDLTSGRFRGTDPVNPPVIDQYVSTYAYAKDRPGVYTDPSGQYIVAAPPSPILAPVFAGYLGWQIGTFIAPLVNGDPDEEPPILKKKGEIEQGVLDAITKRNADDIAVRNDDDCDCIHPGRDALDAARKEFRQAKRAYWKNEALVNPGAYTAEDLAKMLRKGTPPRGSDGFPMELHHVVPLECGGSNDPSNFAPMTRNDHRLGDNFGRNHPRRRKG